MPQDNQFWLMQTMSLARIAPFPPAQRQKKNIQY
jgi:hypothetical protein